MSAPSILGEVCFYLACPICGTDLILRDGVVCENAHAFDMARQGYVSFLVGRSPHTGDTAAMVESRGSFLGAGHYDAIATAVSQAVSASAGLVVDIAAGTGFYLARVLDDHPELVGLALDVSTAAAKRAAKAHERAAAATADAWKRMPVGDGQASAILSIFGPRNGDEVSRILAPDGVAIVVTPMPDHLRELRDRFGMLAIQDDKDARLDTQLAALRLLGRERLEYAVSLGPAEVLDEIFMGPSAFHLDRSDVAKRVGPEPLAVTVSVTVSAFARS
jgi:23S rRNA (guanine745-N1)-methyltransferase